MITAVMLFAMKVLRTGAGPFPLIWDWDRKPPASLVELVSVASQEVYAACGFNTALWGGSQAASVREAWRLALFGVLSPLGRLVESELQAKLDDAVSLTWTELRASDLSGRARAFQSMVGLAAWHVPDAVDWRAHGGRLDRFPSTRGDRSCSSSPGCGRRGLPPHRDRPESEIPTQNTEQVPLHTRG